MVNVLLDFCSDVILCDVSLMEKFRVVGRFKEFLVTIINGVFDIRKGFELFLFVGGL